MASLGFFPFYRTIRGLPQFIVYVYKEKRFFKSSPDRHGKVTDKDYKALQEETPVVNAPTLGR
jgi:hypothetical protein